MPVNLVKKIGGAINITYGQYNGYVYFFHEDGTYSRFNRLTCELEYYNDINKGWNGWPAQWVYPHTAISWDNQYVYFFRGPEFICYNMVRDCVEGSIASVQQRWPGWPVDWLDRIDAALYWGYHLTNKTKQNNRYIYEIHKKAYFFRNDEYIRYDIENNRVDENYPLKIKEYWHGWPDHWTQVWAAVDWGNGKVYFFSETEYLCYDKFFDRVDDGYPRPLYEFFTEHQDKLNQESHTLIFEDQIPQASRSNFTNAVRSIATQLNIRPNWLMASIWTESGFNPLAKNGQYYGLHQMSLLLIYTYWGKTALKAKFPTLFHGQAFNELTNEAKSKLASEFSNWGLIRSMSLADG